MSSDSMTALVRKAVDTFGRLTAVHAWSDTLGQGSASPFRVDELTFAFEHGTITFAADDDTDSLTMSEFAQTSVEAADLTQRRPWADAVGCGILWFWLLENQNGYVDGAQVEFADGTGKHVTVQLMYWASGFNISTIVDIADGP